jgi:nucleoside-diphosphate-sugar epimerase
MRVLVTGASGGIGSVSCRELHRAGHEVIATDRVDRGKLPMKLHVANLLDRHAVSALCERLDAVLHLGNHTGYKPADPQLVFGENMVMNINVFASAQAAGVKKMVFASSIQVIASQPRLPDDAVDALPYLPLDGEIPEFSTNPYALSKACGENMLRFYTRVYGTQTVAIRFPSTGEPEWYASVVAKFPEFVSRTPTLGFSFMTHTDAGRLCAATIAAHLPGYRCYLPSSAHNIVRQPAARLLREFYADVPIRKPIGDGTATLVDLSGITADTGWRPME